MAQLYQLEQSQWWPEEVLRVRQFEQFGALARYACAHSQWYRARFADAGLAPEGPWDDERFRGLPLLTRTDLLTHADAIHCDEPPKSHGPIRVAQTSGSTGQIVAVKRTSVNQLMWLALNMRDHLWHRRDFLQTAAVIRAHVRTLDDEVAARRFGWGPPATLLHATGPGYAHALSADVAQLAEWLLLRNPRYLLTYPTNIRALLDWFERTGRKPENLGEIRTLGETLSQELVTRCKEVLGVPVTDAYSSEEVGAIALMCPTSRLYHVHAESLIVEVLDEKGRRVRPGETGRVVLTDLHNLATPIIRYELRDHAELGPACSCGRGLPTLARILGRQRNMVVLPNGEKHWPLVGLRRYREVAEILQYQLVQRSFENVEMRLVTASALTPAQEGQLTEIVRKALGHPFRISVRYFDGELPRTRSGKFEEFVCEVEGVKAENQ